MSIGRIGSLSNEILVHESDTSDVHGITNTSLLVTLDGVQSLNNKTLGSPAMSGTPTAPTAAAGTNTTQIATTAFVTAASNLKANLASPTFTGTVVLPSTTSIGDVSSTELGYLDGVTSAIQTQLNAKAALASPALSGTPTAPTAAADTNTTQLATTAYVVGQAASASPVMDGTVAVGTSLRFARADHVHPTDTSRAPLYPTIDNKTASYTLVLTDAGKVITMGSGSAQVVTIPLNSSVAFPVGTKIDIVQTGAGECSVTPTSGVTLLSDSSKRKVNIQYAAVSCIKTATDTWLLIGALKA